MNDTLFQKVYNPDVLSCLSNLSNDEVFTPPEVVNQMLDLLPQELFRNPDTTFLDPACKTGVFLREIAKRLIKGLEPQFPDLQERVDHIFHKQLFGIAITELTSLLSRRGLYCSKFPNGELSVSHFDTAEGNIRYKRTQHTWKDGKCVFCGANKEQYARGDALETYAYEFIHAENLEKLFDMKFDVIIGNPPYQLSDGGNGASAKPIYNLFVEQAKKLKPRFLSMIIPSRWFAGGKGLDDFRASMLDDNHLTKLVDYANAKECFSGISLSGGVCYFLWEKDANRMCEVTNIKDGVRNTITRSLKQYPILVRYNDAISIIEKVLSQNEHILSKIVSGVSPFGIETKVRGVPNKDNYHGICLHASVGQSYLAPEEVPKGKEWLDKYKVIVSQTSAEHAGEPSKDGRFRVVSGSLKAIGPNEVCTHSYLTVGPFEDMKTTENCCEYFKTKFVRFLILQAITSIHLTRGVFMFVPTQDFSKPWTDEELYTKYNLTQEEIDFIESMIKPMDLNDGDDNG
ncbi:MAG: Eco57I restriction-modification methylase domain-containing protein [Clostridia bacterium]|nr:Eco57I restriction-modification methylase domain-containing protein [Clostridia bacterium]MDY6184558.1 Eco57I restriction-modification methylase domain-containing protein [Eubacteriales bacterium]